MTKMDRSIAYVVTCIGLFGCLLAPKGNAQTALAVALSDSVDSNEFLAVNPHGFASLTGPSLVAPVAYCDEPIACDAAPAGFCGGCGLGRQKDCIWAREELTGDWCGKRTCLAENGIAIQSSLTQFYQGVASGGAEQRFRYGAKFDLFSELNN